MPEEICKVLSLLEADGNEPEVTEAHQLKVLLSTRTPDDFISVNYSYLFPHSLPLITMALRYNDTYIPFVVSRWQGRTHLSHEHCQRALLPTLPPPCLHGNVTAGNMNSAGREE